MRKIQFDDGVEWIARLRMPPMPDRGNRGGLSRRGEDSPGYAIRARPRWSLCGKCTPGYPLTVLRSLFWNQNTDISIPKVYGYDLNDQNPV